MQKFRKLLSKGLFYVTKFGICLCLSKTCKIVFCYYCNYFFYQCSVIIIIIIIVIAVEKVLTFQTNSYLCRPCLHNPLWHDTKTSVIQTAITLFVVTITQLNKMHNCFQIMLIWPILSSQVWHQLNQDFRIQVKHQTGILIF